MGDVAQNGWSAGMHCEWLERNISPVMLGTIFLALFLDFQDSDYASGT